MTQTVRLMSDYDADWPLWHEGGTTRGDWPQVSPELAADLERWNLLWERHHDHRRGWTSEAMRELYDEQAPQLVDRLQVELGADWRVHTGPLG
ncbi:hypothetical protein GCM10027020_08370 [Nocardioides salsibiostraticola]